VSVRTASTSLSFHPAWRLVEMLSRIGKPVRLAIG
jgi:hypothetical protein